MRVNTANTHVFVLYSPNKTNQERTTKMKKAIMNRSLGKRKVNSNTKESLELLMLAVPGIILTIIFCYIPMFGVVIAFKNYNPNLGILGSEWVGFKNFEFFFTSNDFGRLMRNTVLYSVWFLIINNLSAIVVATMFYNVRSKSALKYYQTTAILPSFMSIVLISYIVYIFLNPSIGVLNVLLESLGLDRVNWYAEPKYWPVILSIVEVWKGVGMGCLIYYATMVGIDETLFEAARMDGANKWQQIVNILIPEISTLICLNIIRGVGGIIGGDFGLFYQIPRNVGALYETTDILNTYTFRALQTGSNFGRTGAIGLFSSVAGMILIVISNTVIKKIDEDKSMF